MSSIELTAGLIFALGIWLLVNAIYNVIIEEET